MSVYDNYSDSAIWSAIQNDDREAFEYLYRQYIHNIYFEVSKRIKDSNAVDDLVQDIFLSLWEKRHQYRPSAGLYYYLRGMAINRVLNYFRSQRNSPEYVEIWENIPDDLVSLEDFNEAFRQAQNQEFESMLKVAVDALPPKMKQVYILRFEEDRDVQDIADLLSSSPHTIRNQLKSIRKKFAQTLKKTSFYTFL